MHFNFQNNALRETCEQALNFVSLLMFIWKLKSLNMELCLYFVEWQGFCPIENENVPKNILEEKYPEMIQIRGWGS